MSSFWSSFLGSALATGMVGAVITYFLTRKAERDEKHDD